MLAAWPRSNTISSKTKKFRTASVAGVKWTGVSMFHVETAVDPKVERTGKRLGKGTGQPKPVAQLPWPRDVTRRETENEENNPRASKPSPQKEEPETVSPPTRVAQTTTVLQPTTLPEGWTMFLNASRQVLYGHVKSGTLCSRIPEESVTFRWRRLLLLAHLVLTASTTQLCLMTQDEIRERK